MDKLITRCGGSPNCEHYIRSVDIDDSVYYVCELDDGTTYDYNFCRHLESSEAAARIEELEAENRRLKYENEGLRNTVDEQAEIANYWIKVGGEKATALKELRAKWEKVEGELRDEYNSERVGKYAALEQLAARLGVKI